MKRQWTIANNIAWIVVLVMVVTAQTVVGADTPPPEAEVLSLETAAAAMDSEISYQGVLKSNGVPVNGARNFSFELHNEAGCTLTALETIDKPAVPVVNGRFNVSLLIKHYHFNGQKLYLQVVMGTTRLMCEEILAVPYALSVKPGAEVNNLNAEVAINTFDSGKNIAKGIEATAMGGTTNYGVVGIVDNAAGAGVYAISNYSTADALYARNSHGGLAGNFQGDVAQNTDAYGLVKAGVRVFCGSGFSIYQKFPLSVSGSGSNIGECEIDFGFDLTNRFWAVSSASTAAAVTTCYVSATDNNVLKCFRFNLAGTATSGVINILIY